MAPVSVARAVLVCALVAGSSARADDADPVPLPVPPPTARRPVAIVDLGTDSKELVDNLEEALNNHAALERMPSALDVALGDRIVDEDQDDIAKATQARKDAEDALAAFDFKTAATYADAGEKALARVTPSRAAKIYAGLELVEGQARLGLRDGKGADAAFALVHVLDPALALEAALYLPEVVAAFDHARMSAETRLVEIQGTGRVWIDGHDVGAAPGSFSLAVGTHLVQIAGPERMTAGREVTVVAEDPKAPRPMDPVVIEESTIEKAVLIHRARSLLAQASDPVSRAGAMTHLASLVEVKDAVLLRNDAGALVYEVWHEGSGLAGAKAVSKDSIGRYVPDAGKILDDVEPPKPTLVVRKTYPIPLPHPPKWYEKRRYQAGILGGVIAIVATSILISRYEGTIHNDMNLAPVMH
jgi:hypothetical protein